MKKMRNEKGFTLIEIVMVIVLLGILAAVAIPRFIDLSTEAEAAALQGVVGSISSASAANYAAQSAGSASAVAITGLTCQAAATAILQGGIPAGYTLDNAAALVQGVNTCVVTQTSSTNSANATVIGE